LFHRIYFDIPSSNNIASELIQEYRDAQKIAVVTIQKPIHINIVPTESSLINQAQITLLKEYSDSQKQAVYYDGVYVTS
jgi:hypothetical protein